MYIAAGQGQTTPEDKILMSTETTCHFGHLLQVSKKNPWSLILYIFFMIFIHVYSPGARADNPLGMKILCQQEHLVTSVICCKFQKKSHWSLILYNFFHDVYSPGAGVDSPPPPPGTKFWCQQKGLITLLICCKFQRNLFEVWFYTFFFMI